MSVGREIVEKIPSTKMFSNIFPCAMVSDFVSAFGSQRCADAETMVPPVILHCFGGASGILRDYPIIIHPFGERDPLPSCNPQNKLTSTEDTCVKSGGF